MVRGEPGEDGGGSGAVRAPCIGGGDRVRSGESDAGVAEVPRRVAYFHGEYEKRLRSRGHRDGWPRRGEVRVRSAGRGL